LNQQDREEEELLLSQFNRTGLNPRKLIFNNFANGSAALRLRSDGFMNPPL
jgi:hypothetical protein